MSYQGDGDYPAAVSAPVTLTVNRVATSTVLAVPTLPVPEAKPDTFRATVTSAAGTPTGNVVFKEGTTVLGTAELLDGTATLTITTLPAGDHAITARYQGDDDHAPSGTSPQTNVVWTAVHAYVDDLYLRFMGRPVDASGLTWWSTYLTDQGGLPSTVTHLLVTTGEARRYQVGLLYQDLLGRSVDGSGRAYWSKFLVDGGRFDVLQAQLLGSDEFFAAAGGTNSAFVTALFRNAQVYDRSPSAAELLWWTTLLDSGQVTRTQVVLAQLRSDAVLKPSVAAAYQDVLGRGLDKSGLDFWSRWYVANRNDPWALRGCGFQPRVPAALLHGDHQVAVAAPRDPKRLTPEGDRVLRGSAFGTPAAPLGGGRRPSFGVAGPPVAYRRRAPCSGTSSPSWSSGSSPG